MGDRLEHEFIRETKWRFRTASIHVLDNDHASIQWAKNHYIIFSTMELEQ